MIGMRSSQTLVRGIIGLSVVVLGVLLLLDNLGIADREDFLLYWPVALIAIGAAKLVWGGDRPVGPIILIAVGAWILLWNLDYIPYSFWDFWPLLIVFLGVKMVWHAIRPYDHGGEVQRKAGSVDHPADALSATAVLGANQISSSSKDFRGGNILALLGGAEVNLRNARIEEDAAILDVFVLWGGIDIFVPPDWVVINEVTPILGGSEDKTRPTADAKQRLVIRGAVIMGGLDIAN